MNVLIYCPDQRACAAICLHLVDVGNYQPLIAETEALVVAIALHNDIGLVLLYDPPRGRSLVDLKDFLREKRRLMRVRLLPDKQGALMPGWREVINDALKPLKKRKSRGRLNHPRFNWKPNY